MITTTTINRIYLYTIYGHGYFLFYFWWFFIYRRYTRIWYKYRSKKSVFFCIDDYDEWRPDDDDDYTTILRLCTFRIFEVKIQIYYIGWWLSLLLLRLLMVDFSNFNLETCWLRFFFAICLVPIGREKGIKWIPMK